ncbi:carboxylesterase family protein [Dactylosporangium sp. NPDC000244]|uniref:carboxylesterase family protein n=1 Tax=Dactylosporangium sp. NPDC000244 TaxID=3154365 RepID=UPI0033202AB7
MGVFAPSGACVTPVPQCFQRARPSLGWSGVFDATVPKAMAPQAPFGDIFRTPPGGFSEDCLYLNLHVPNEPSLAPRPVLVWIHGGAGGSGAANQYDGTALARQGDLVVVTINYRLGPLAQVDVAEWGPGYEGSGDLAFYDQVLALEWVRDHVGDFGGDPQRVTIAGESAGAGAVVELCASPVSAGLFRGAIASSAPVLSGRRPGGHLAELGKKLKLAPEELRRRLVECSWPQLFDLAAKARGRREVAKTYLRGRVADLIAAKGERAPDLVIGYACHEGDSMEFLMRRGLRRLGPLAGPALHLLMLQVVPHVAGGRGLRGEYLRRLRREHGVRYGARFNDLVWTDLFRRGAVEAAEGATRSGARAHLYELDVPTVIAGQRMRSTHGVDISLTFNCWRDPGAMDDPLTDDPHAPALADRWVAMIAQFCRTGSADGPLGAWPAYDLVARRVLRVTPQESRVLRDPDPEYRQRVWPERAE